jgi:hypothetical protein
LTDVLFDGKQEEELGMRFGESDFFISGRTTFEASKTALEERVHQLELGFNNMRQSK